MGESTNNFKDYLSERPYWKKVWQVSSGNIKDITASEIEKSLVVNKELLLDGLLQYAFATTLSEESSKKSSKQEKKEFDTSERKRKKFQKFMMRLTKYLKVQKQVAWKILTSYIMYEYCGSLKNLEKLKYEMHILPMLSNIWRFYTSERMFKLKILKTCLEFMDVKDHPYATIYRRFIYDIGIRNIWDSLINQYKFLLTEITSSSFDNDTPMKLWLERNFREQIEILHCLIILVDYASITLVDYKEVLMLFKSHGFGAQPSSFEALLIVEQASFDKLKYAEVALLLCMANNFWGETKNWYEENEEEDIDEDMELLICHDEFAPVVYIWIIMHMVLPNAVDLFSNKYSKWTDKCLNLKIFNFFCGMIKHEMFEHTSVVGVNVREAMYHLLFITCSKFNQGDSLLIHPGVLELTAELLKTPQLSEEFFEQGPNGLMIMWSHTMNLFPYRFATIAVLAEAIILSNPENVEAVMKEVEVIQYYTMAADLKNPENNIPPDHLGKYTVVRRLTYTELTSTSDLPPDTVYFKHNDIPLVRFTRDNNLWLELFEMLNKALVVGSDMSVMMDTLTSGLKLTVAVLKQEKLSLHKYPYIKNIIKACINMFVKCSGEREPPLKLLSLCLDILTELLSCYRSDLLPKLNSNKLLPSLLKPVFNYRDMFRIDFVIPGLIGNLIITHEKNSEQHFLVISYLNFLRTSLQCHKGNYSIIELPGLIFVLKVIYLNFRCWYANQDSILKEVLYQCIHILYEMFQFTAEQLETDPARKTMHDITLCCLLDENCARIFLKMLVNGSNNLQFMMENQTNLYYGNGVKYISTIQMILSLLLQILELRKSITDQGPFPLENFIYSENHNLKVIKAVANLLNHPFNNSIPNLACRLLKKFTLELDTSMLASLELEPDQIRLMFLQRLRDSLESDELKSAIVELITASIACQPGMTEAFFTTIGSEPEQESNSDGQTSSSRNELALNENVGNFMVEYLMQATLDSSCLHSPLLYKIMQLFHVLWMNQKEMLIIDLINDEQFWASLCYPLFKEICFENKMYAQIFNIITKEIHKQNGKISPALLQVLNKLFSIEENYIDMWTKHIFDEENISKELNLTKPYPSLLNSWKNLIIVCIKLMPDDFIPLSYKIKITNVCRESLKNHVMSLEDNSTIIYCAELYLFLMTHWSNIYCMDGEILYGDIINLLHKVAISYRILPKRLQEIVLAVSAVSFKSLKTIIPDNLIAANTLVESIIQIFNYEYDSLQQCCKNKSLYTFDRKTHQGYFLCFAILNELLTATNSDIKTDYMTWLNQSEIFRIILECAGILTKHVTSIPLAKDALETLIFYVSLEESVNFIDTDTALQLWKKFLPTKEYFKPTILGTVQPVPGNLKDWWKIYKRLMIFLIVLLKKHKHIVLKEVVMFVSLHEDYIKEILLLVVNSVDFIALDLVLITLNLIYELIKYKYFWLQDHEPSYYNIIETIKMTLQCSAALIVRPNMLKYFTINKFGQKAILSEQVPTENLVKLINMITNIVTISTNCILLISPPLYPSIRDNQDYSYWDLQLDTNFGLPKLGNSELTFGTLLCLSCLYVRILQQINQEKKSHIRKDTLTEHEEKQSQNIDNNKKQATDDPDDCSSVTKLKCLITKPNYSESCIGFIRLDYLNPLCNLSSVQNFSYSTSVTIFPWYAQLNKVFVSKALETILTLLASQVGPLLKYRLIEKHDKRYIRRELCSELQVFYDYVRKKLVDLYCYTGKDRSSFLRKKVIRKVVFEKVNKKRGRCWAKSNISPKSTSPEISPNTSKHSLLKSPEFKELTIDEQRHVDDSTEDGNTDADVYHSLDKIRKKSVDHIDIHKRNIYGSSRDAEPVFITEDYFHLLSNWFMYALKTDNK